MGHEASSSPGPLPLVLTNRIVSILGLATFLPCLGSQTKYLCQRRKYVGVRSAGEEGEKSTSGGSPVEARILSCEPQSSMNSDSCSSIGVSLMDSFEALLKRVLAQGLVLSRTRCQGPCIALGRSSWCGLVAYLHMPSKPLVFTLAGPRGELYPTLVQPEQEPLTSPHLTLLLSTSTKPTFLSSLGSWHPADIAPCCFLLWSISL